MYSNYDWFLAIIRIAGASFPGASSLVQLQAELDSHEIQKRLDKLEDPISSLHPDIPKLSSLLYRELEKENNERVDFDNDFYRKYSKPLAILDKKNYISILNTVGSRYPSNITLSDPSFIMYLCRIAEDEKKMNSLIELMENCEYGEWLDGKKVELDLPLPVIRAVFEIYESKGYGICSNEVGTGKYVCKA